MLCVHLALLHATYCIASATRSSSEILPSGGINTLKNHALGSDEAAVLPMHEITLSSSRSLGDQLAECHVQCITEGRGFVPSGR